MGCIYGGFDTMISYEELNLLSKTSDSIILTFWLQPNLFTLILILSIAIFEISTASISDDGFSIANVIAIQPEPEHKSMADLNFFFYIHQW